MWMNDSRSIRPPALLDTTILRIDPLARWWSFEDVVCVALRSPHQVPVVSVAGAFDERAVHPCTQALGAALRARPTHIVIDLSAVSDSSASCVALLESMQRSAIWHGAQLWLAGVPATVREALRRSGRLPAFSISRTTARALDEMHRPGGIRRSA